VLGDLNTAAVNHPENAGWTEAVNITCRAVIGLADRYMAEAGRIGRADIAAVFQRIPRKGASTLREALQFLRLLHFSLWCEGLYHIGLGRFDQTFYPYFKADLDAGRLTAESALELIEDFFISCNRDSDLYPGMQQGDNGQSLTLGGYNPDGTDCYNELSELCIKASLALAVIDPKINLRVSSKTSLERYLFASHLTAAGLGFPQYCNDDVVVKGMLRKGYDINDACDYTVAACWEFIVPKCGFDIPNIDALSFVRCADIATRNYLAGCTCFAEFQAALCAVVKSETAALLPKHRNIFLRPAPFASVLAQGCVENARDISLGLKYNNYGIHGTGLASAADWSAAVNMLIFESDGAEKITASQLVDMLDANFEGYGDIRGKVMNAAPKMGNDDDFADGIGAALLSAFAEALDGVTNERGGCYRAGTGSAMYYVTHAREVGAGADGRLHGGYLPANYSPSLGIKLNGPVSIVNSFTKPDLAAVINGGPLTLEFAATAVRDETGIGKLALLVQNFIRRGGHQLQLNVIDKRSLLDARLHPENYRNLVVRVWGWSGYFTELDEVYQEQIIKRADLSV
jgi:formate C-acetyltransferase